MLFVVFIEVGIQKLGGTVGFGGGSVVGSDPLRQLSQVVGHLLVLQILQRVVVQTDLQKGEETHGGGKDGKQRGGTQQDG